jgi:hypothetical protein
VKIFVVVAASLGALVGLSDIVFAERWTRWHNKPRDRRGWRALVKPIPIASARQNALFGLVELVGWALILVTALTRP